jgi:uncharacterized protein DUF6496
MSRKNRKKGAVRLAGIGTDLTQLEAFTALYSTRKLLKGNRIAPLVTGDIRLEEKTMPEKKTIKRARKLKREGKSPSTQAGEFVREEIHHVREGKHGARSPEQAIAIGLSKARRAGVRLPPPKKGKSTAAVRRSAVSALRKGRSRQEPSATRSRATLRALRHEKRGTASASSLSRHARSAARKRGPRNLSEAAKKAARTRARH